MHTLSYKLKDSFSPVVFLLPQRNVREKRPQCEILRFCFINKVIKMTVA